MFTNALPCRRRFIQGLGAVALNGLLQGGAPHFTPKVKRVIQIMCPGGVSHLDTFDYKPELIKRSGQPMPGGEKEVSFQGANAACSLALKPHGVVASRRHSPRP